MLQNIDEEEEEESRRVLKAPRLQLTSSALSPAKTSWRGGYLKERKSLTIPFDVVQLRQEASADAGFNWPEDNILNLGFNSHDQEESGEFFLNFGGGGDKMEDEEGGWNLFG